MPVEYLGDQTRQRYGAALSNGGPYDTTPRFIA
jgi:hypothetical protein